MALKRPGVKGIAVLAAAGTAMAGGAAAAVKIRRGLALIGSHRDAGCPRCEMQGTVLALFDLWCPATGENLPAHLTLEAETGTAG